MLAKTLTRVRDAGVVFAVCSVLSVLLAVNACYTSTCL